MALTTDPETPLSLHQRQPMCVGPDHFYRFSRSRPEMGCRGVNSMIWRRLVMQDDIGTWSLRCSCGRLSVQTVLPNANTESCSAAHA